MDGVSENIENYFKETYSSLYNSVDDMLAMETLKDDINAMINMADLEEILKVTPEVVKNAATCLKNSKTDPVYTFSSDCFKHAPYVLHQHLSLLIRSFLLHGHVTNFLLLATLVPIVKNKLASITSSKKL